MDTNTAGRRMQAALIIQLFASHVLVTFLTWWLVLRGHEYTARRQLFAAALTGLLGALLTFNLHRAVTLVYRGLDRLNRTLPIAPRRALPVDPLAPLLAQLNDLARRDVGSLRESLLAQTREAAAQQERNRLARDLHRRPSLSEDNKRMRHR